MDVYFWSSGSLVCINRIILFYIMFYVVLIWSLNFVYPSYNSQKCRLHLVGMVILKWQLLLFQRAQMEGCAMSHRRAVGATSVPYLMIRTSLLEEEWTKSYCVHEMRTSRTTVMFYWYHLLQLITLDLFHDNNKCRFLYLNLGVGSQYY